jgi:hypothetical protein
MYVTVVRSTHDEKNVMQVNGLDDDKREDALSCASLDQCQPSQRKFNLFFPWKKIHNNKREMLQEKYT